MTRIVNPFAGHTVGADWEWHKRHGFHGGTDYSVNAGVTVTSPAAGVASPLGDALNSVKLALGDGRMIVIRELRAVSVRAGTTVAIGTAIGVTGRRNGSIIMWPHIEGTAANGTRIPFEPMIGGADGAAPAGMVAAAIGGGFAFNPPAAGVQARIQRALTKRGRYGGPANGVFGPNTIKGIQRSITGVGYSGPQNGIPGERTCHFIQVYARRFGGYTGPINSVMGSNGWEGFARGIEAGLG